MFSIIEPYTFNQNFKMLGILLLSLIFTFALSVPFINLLYRLKMQRRWEGRKHIKSSFLRRYHGWKVGTPVGGGILILISIFIFSLIFYSVTSFSINWTSLVLFATLLLFGLLGLYDDLQKMFGFRRTRFWGLRFRHKLIFQMILSFVIALLLQQKLNISTLYIPFFPHGIWWEVSPPLFILMATFTIVAGANAYNITDGLDGLSTGLFLILLVPLWILSGRTTTALDAQLFMAVLMGSLLAFLYFNIYPARMWLGDTGALAFGALMVVISLMSQAFFVFPLLAGVFVLEALSSLLQMFARRWLKKKIFLMAPLHHHFEALGWDETKVVMRFWLTGAIFAVVGLFYAYLGA